jgi:hypothetical protein
MQSKLLAQYLKEVYEFEICKYIVRNTKWVPNNYVLWEYILSTNKNQTSRSKRPVLSAENKVTHKFFLYIAIKINKAASLKNHYTATVHASTQSAPGGKVNILGSHSIGHSKQRSVSVNVSYPERFSR